MKNVTRTQVRRMAAAMVLAVMVMSGCVETVMLPPGAHEPTRPVQQVAPPVAVKKAQPVSCAVALALPLSGPYGAIGAKILNGARVAQSTLAGQGVAVEIHEIDCSAPDWLKKLQALPPTVGVVGGPLNPEALDELAKSGQFKSRAFFAFMQNVGKVAEGQDAWRFFSAPADQIRTLLRTVKQDFSISRVGILYPDEPFGARIAQLFQDEAAKAGVSVGGKSSYPPDDPLRWADIVATFLGGGQPGGTPPFDAVFLPDVWSKVEMLLPYLSLHQSEQLLVLGSTLWGQTYSKEVHVPAHLFRLAIFPGIWWPRPDAPAMTELRRFGKPGQEEPAVWDVVGFDFIRFAAHVGPLPAAWSPALVNERIRLAQTMPWNMAPISWDSKGHAQQNMLLYSPANKAVEPADLYNIRQRRDAIMQRSPAKK